MRKPTLPTAMYTGVCCRFKLGLNQLLPSSRPWVENLTSLNFHVHELKANNNSPEGVLGGKKTDQNVSFQNTLRKQLNLCLSLIPVNVCLYLLSREVPGFLSRITN